LRDKAMRDLRGKYDEAMAEAGMLLISLSNSGVITDQRLKLLVAEHELYPHGGLVGKPVENVFALYVGGPRFELSDSQGRIVKFQYEHGTNIDGKVIEFLSEAPPDGNGVVEATRKALGEPPPPDPVQCLLYADFCLSLAKQVGAVPPAPETPLPDEQQNHRKLPQSAEKAYGLYAWALTQDPGPTNQKDLAVYNWLSTNPKISKDDLPWTFKSFQTLLGKARKHHGTSKHQSRQGRSGRSIRESEQF